LKSALSDRLMQFCANHCDQVAEQWYQALTTNSKTQAYRLMSKEACLRHARYIYSNLENLYFAEDPEKAVSNLLDVNGFVEDHYARKIPLDQVIYAIILFRRHLWLYAESQALYNGVDDMMQMVESVNRVLLIFDYLMYTVASKYRCITANST
jgi:hypothetical protein